MTTTPPDKISTKLRLKMRWHLCIQGWIGRLERAGTDDATARRPGCGRTVDPAAPLAAVPFRRVGEIYRPAAPIGCGWVLHGM